MQICNRCGVKIRGYKKACPLCGGPLMGEPEHDVYPVLKKKMTRPTVIRFSLFIFVAFMAFMIIVRVMTGHMTAWMPLALISSVIALIDICVTVYYRSNPIKTIVWETYTGMVICLIVDRFTGWRAWSVEWVLPCAFAGVMIAVMAVGAGLKLMLQDFVLYLVFDAVCSLLQIIFIYFELNPFVLPALISMGLCVVLFVGILIFRWRDFRSASSRYFNL